MSTNGKNSYTERERNSAQISPITQAFIAARSQQPASLLTLDQVASLLGTSKGWVRDHATRRHPRIPVVRFGDKHAVLRFRPQDVEAFIKNNFFPPRMGTMTSIPVYNRSRFGENVSSTRTHCGGKAHAN
jgi:hypothetical protein